MHSSKTAAISASPPKQDSKLPQLIILGAQKSGTTALATYLGQHPRLLHPKRKEVNFSAATRAICRGSIGMPGSGHEAKNAIFGRLALILRGNEIRFEASPHYLRSPNAAARIHDCLPAARLIAIFRDPVERAYSAWQMYRKQLAGNPAFYDAWNRRIFFPEVVAELQPREPAELDDFELAIRREADYLARGKSMVWSLLEYGFYGEQIARYLRHFPREQLLILQDRDLRIEPSKRSIACRIHRIANMGLVEDRFITGAFQRQLSPIPVRTARSSANSMLSNRQFLNLDSISRSLAALRGVPIWSAIRGVDRLQAAADRL